MNNRFLTITARADWRDGLRAAASASAVGSYQGEVLNFESPDNFFGQLTPMRLAITRAVNRRGELSAQEIAHLLGREVKRVHHDIVVLLDLGLLEKRDTGRVRCPYASMHIDVQLLPC